MDRFLSILFAVVGNAAALAPSVSASTELTAIDDFSRDKAIFDSGAHRGLDAATVPVSGTATLADGVTPVPDGTAVEGRVVEFHDRNQPNPDTETGFATAWESLGTTTGGAYAGTLSAPRRAHSWYRVETRVQDSSAPPARTANRFAAGHIWAIWGQSNWARNFSDYNSTLNPLYHAALHPGSVQVMHWTDSQAWEVDDANRGTTPITPAMVDFANALQTLRPGEKFFILGHVKSGTGYAQALDDDPDDGRDWQNEVALHQYATADGQQVGVVWNGGWTAANWSLGYASNTARVFLGKDLDGTPVTPSPRGFSKNTTYGADHDGLYDWTYSKFGYVGPHGRMRSSIRGVVAADVGDFTELPGYNSDDDETYRKIVRELDTLCNTADPNFPEVLPYFGTTHGAERGSGKIGNGDDMAHMRASDPLGRQRFAAISALRMMRTLGWTTTPMALLNRRHDEPGGAWSDHWIDGNNSLTTLRKALPPSPQHESTVQDLAAHGATIPTDEDHRTEVMGWSINRVAAQRAELHTVTQAEVDAGHPAPVGQVVCRVYPNFDGSFVATDEIVYGVDILPGYQTFNDGGNLEDAPDREGQRTFLDWLVVDMGQPSQIMEWAPVVHQALTFDLPTTLPSPAMFPVNGSEDRFIKANSGVINASQMVWVIEGRINSLSGRRILISGSGNNAPFLEVSSTGSLKLKHSSDSISTPGDAIVEGLLFKIACLIDLDNHVMRITDGEGTILAENTATTQTGTFSIGSADELSFFAEPNGTDPIISAEFVMVEAYLNQTDDTGDPHYAVYGTDLDPFFETVGGIARADQPPPPPDTEAPTVPSGLMVDEASANTVGLAWDASTDNVGVTSYHVYVDGAFNHSVSGTSTTVSGLAPLTTYAFTVSALDAAGNESNPSDPATATTIDGPPPSDDQAPTVPSGLAVSNLTPTTVELGWTPSTDDTGVTGYLVYVDGAFTEIVSANSVTVSGLVPGTDYALTLSAVDAAGNESAQSAPLTITTAALPQASTIVGFHFSNGDLVPEVVDPRLTVQNAATDGAASYPDASTLRIDRNGTNMELRFEVVVEAGFQLNLSGLFVGQEGQKRANSGNVSLYYDEGAGPIQLPATDHAPQDLDRGGGRADFSTDEITLTGLTGTITFIYAATPSSSSGDWIFIDELNLTGSVGPVNGDSDTLGKPALRIRITSGASTTPSIELKWHGRKGFRYQLKTSTDLQNWSDAHDISAVLGNDAVETLSLELENLPLFYRLEFSAPSGT